MQYKLNSEILNYLKFLNFQLNGYKTLINEFLYNDTEQEINISKENFESLLEKFNEISGKILIALETIIGKKIASYEINFFEGIVTYETI